MGKLSQLTGRQVEQIKRQNDGSAFVKEIVHVKAGAPFLRPIDIRENDVFLLTLVKLYKPKRFPQGSQKLKGMVVA